MNATDRVAQAYARISEVDRPDVWITLRPMEAALADAALVDQRVAQDDLPLAGLTLAVKDNIDVAGLPTTAGCPAFAYQPDESAPAVQRLVSAGAVVLGKTNLDQFATGLVGTRSPYGAVRDTRRDKYVSGGSSSGSAVAVALGIADLALGTDTAGSGRVPAAFQGIVGIKPTRGIVPTRGVVPACRTLDCVTVFARELALAELAVGVTGAPAARPWPRDAPLAAPPVGTIAVPRELPGLSPAATAAFRAATAHLADSGHELVEIDIDPLLAAGRLLYDGAFVAERYAAVGKFVERHLDVMDPTVGSIISAAGRLPAYALVVDGERLESHREAAEGQLRGADALLLPTAPRQPTIAEVAADPRGTNAELGSYTTFVNLLDLCAVAVPWGEVDGGQFGVSVIGRAFTDRVVADFAARLINPPERAADRVSSSGAGPLGVRLFVVGAHGSSQPLTRELTARGARQVGPAATAADYRLFRLETEPHEPGLVRVRDGGASIEGELWELPVAHLGELLSELPMPMALGPVQLADGATSIGVLCEPDAAAGAEDITHHRDWKAYPETTSRPHPAASHRPTTFSARRSRSRAP